MPRKQRFKPSRKPQSTQGTAPGNQLDDRKDFISEREREQRADTSVIASDPDGE